jgi:hypothetical protein
MVTTRHNTLFDTQNMPKLIKANDVSPFCSWHSNLDAGPRRAAASALSRKNAKLKAKMNHNSNSKHFG